MKLFSTSGIRRKVIDLPPHFVVDIGIAISKGISINNDSTILVARDARSSGQLLEHAICAGIVASGSNIERMGIVPTPALAYHTFKTAARAGVMLTASHNPPEYNGIKIFDNTGMGLSPEDEERIEKTYEGKKFSLVQWDKIGGDRENYGSTLYNEMLLNAGSNINWQLFDSIIADPGGGACCEVINKVYPELGMNLVTINGLFDPYFSARLSEPVPENLTELLAYVQKRNEKRGEKSIGLAYDGDADRCVAIDEKGRYVPQDILLSLYSQYAVEQNAGKGTIITHLDASMLMEKLIEESGGNVKRTKVGDVAIGNMIASEKAIFGGEPCGAWIFPEYHLCPDGPLTGIKILEWIAESGPLYKLVDSTQDYPVNRKKITCENDLKTPIMDKISEQILSMEKLKHILQIDGLRFSFEDDSWVLIRPSGTEPYIRITSQALTEKDSIDRLKFYSNMVEKEIKRSKK